MEKEIGLGFFKNDVYEKYFLGQWLHLQSQKL
jgi:hypothetical protein